MSKMIRYHTFGPGAAMRRLGPLLASTSRVGELCLIQSPSSRSKPETQARKFSTSSKPKIAIQKSNPSVLELVKSFPSGLTRLISCIQAYQNINEAAFSKHNTWSNSNNGLVGYIPRRQSEQKRKLKRDLTKVALPVGFAAIPFIGNSIFPIIAFSPSFFLSSHFLEGYQRPIAHDEYRDRLGAFEACANYFWVTVLREGKERKLDVMAKLKRSDDGKAGAIVDGCALYDLCHDRFPNHIPRQQLLKIAIVAGMSPVIVAILPSVWIRFRLGSIAKDIILDDSDLIRDNIYDGGCQSLTDDEILNANSLRGLPCGRDISYDEMRNYLTKHLGIMKPIFENKGGKIGLLGSFASAMFVLHLPAIRLKTDPPTNTLK